MKFEYREIPVGMLKECEEWRANMIEAAAEGDENLLTKYLDSGSLSDEEIKKGLRERALKTIFAWLPAVPRSRTRACRQCSDAIVEYMPSPTEGRLSRVKARAANP